MEKKRIVPVWLSVILLLLSVASMVFYAYDVFRWFSYGGFSSVTIMYIAAFIDALLVLIYFLMGYKKSAAGIFKAYCIVLIIGLMMSLYIIALTLNYENSSLMNTISFFNIMIQIGICFVLTFATDLGKKKSLSMCGILLLLKTMHVLMMIPYGKNMLISSACGLVIYVIAYIMFYCKYADKESRGAQ